MAIPSWEMTVLDRIGVRIDDTEIHLLPERVREIAGNEDHLESIQDVKTESLFNPGEAGVAAARQIVAIHQELGGTATAAS